MSQFVSQALQSAKDQTEKAAIIAEAAFSLLPEATALAARRCVILHWFDQFIVETMLEDSELTLDEMRHAYEQLATLPFIDSVPWGLTFQDVTREGLLRRYAATQPELLQTAARLAAPAYEMQEEDKKCIAEAFYCYLVAGDQASATALQQALFAQASSNQDWQYVNNLLQLQAEAERLPFVRPLPRDERQLLLQGLVHRVQGKQDAALLDYTQALDMNPASTLAFVSRGTTYAEQQNYDQALADYNTASRIDKNFVPPYLSRSIIYTRLGKYREALKENDRAIQLDPNTDVAYINKGNILNKLGRYEDALAAFNTALQINQNAPEPYIGIGQALTELEHYAEALNAYENAILLNPEEVDAYIGKEKALNGLQSHEEAIETHQFGSNVEMLPLTRQEKLWEKLISVQEYTKTHINRFRQFFTPKERTQATKNVSPVQKKSHRVVSTLNWMNQVGSIGFALLIIGLVIVSSIILFHSRHLNSTQGGKGNIQPGIGLSETSCPAVGNTTSNSLLVVLLDRSGSLIAVPGATDPQHYSTSVTKALAELWPGRMAVVPFQNNVTVVPHFGPATLSDPQQKAALEAQIDATNSTIGGGTPLEAAMRAGLTLLNGAPIGSRVVLITDGAPGNLPPGLSYTQQVEDITGGIIQKYCSEGLPISAFGLNITDPNASALLDEITSGTGGTYQDVTSPKSLSTAVIELYSAWQHLNFVQITGQGGNYAVNFDSFVHQVTFVTFRSNGGYGVTLDGPNNQAVQTSSTATDNHYEIDTVSDGTVFVAGKYTVHVSDVTGNSDPDAQVYALVNSPLLIQILAPTAGQQIAYGKPIEIDADFFNGTNQVTPGKNSAQMIAHVNLIVNGKQVGPTNDIVLTQQGNVFKGQTIAYKQAGQLSIQVDGVFQGDQRHASSNIVLIVPPPPCQLWDFQCQWQQNATSVTIVIGLFFLILVLLIETSIYWLPRRKYGKPYGVLTNRIESLDLSEFHRSPVRSRDIESRGTFNFPDADFNLVFTRNGSVYIEPTKRNGATITVKSAGKSQTLDGKDGRADLSSGGTIMVGNRQVATYSLTVRSNLERF